MAVHVLHTYDASDATTNDMKDYANQLNKLASSYVSNGKRVFILFCGSKGTDGSSWCSDCVRAEPVIADEVAKLDDDAVVLIHVDVGDRAAWKVAAGQPPNPYRSAYQLNGVPTLMNWQQQVKRLGDEDCAKAQLVSMIFED